jgi:hypothetical protein
LDIPRPLARSSFFKRYGSVTDLDYTGGAPMSPRQNCVAGGGVLRRRERKETRSIGLG